MGRMPGERLLDSATPPFPDTLLPAARFPALVQEPNTKAFLESRGTPSQSYASRPTIWRDFFLVCQPSNPPFAKTCGVSQDRESCGTDCSCPARIARWRLGCTAIRSRRGSSAWEFPTNRTDLDNWPLL